MTTDDVPIEPDASLPEAPQAARGHRTKAQADRERRCIVSGEVVPEDKLIRFVAGPGGVVVPDLARKLPGRGLWVTANREAVATAAKKGAFSRAAKAKLSASADLADQVERLLTQRVLDGLGLARRAADLTFGFEKAGGAAKAKLSASADLADQVERLLTQRVLDGLGLARRAADLTFGFEKAGAAISAGKVAWMVEASDGADDGRRKMLQIARRVPRRPRLLGIFTADELSLALGLGNVIHLVFLVGRGADRWTQDVERLSGFRSLIPTSWREEP